MLITHATLDDRRFVESVDRGGMLALIAALGRHLQVGFDAASRLRLDAPDEGFGSLVVCGMGGSGVAGDVVRSLFGGRLAIPVLTSKAYVLPGFVGPRTLVVAVSYSGNTEETIAAYRQARESGASVVTITAGGELAGRSVADGNAHVRIPADIPMPRAAIGYLSGAAIGVVQAAGLVEDVAPALEGAGAVLGALAERLGTDCPVGDNEAKELALWLAGRTPVVWGSEGLAEAAALRWKNQLNENSKVGAFCSILPELDHNEIEGWSPGIGAPFGIVVLRHMGEHPRVGARVSASIEAMGASGPPARQVWGEGDEPLQALFSLMMKADFVSVYLAVLRGVDPTPVPVLMGLKERLSP